MDRYSISRRGFIAGGAVVASSGLFAGRTIIGNKPSYPGDREVSDVVFTIEKPTNLYGEAEVIESRITEERTSKLNFKLTWTGDEKQTLEFGTNEIPFDNPTKSEESPHEVMIIPANMGEGIQRRHGKSWVPVNMDEITAFLPVETHTFKPSESSSWNWQVWGNPKEVDFIPTGRYQFNNYHQDESPNVKLNLALSITNP